MDRELTWHEWINAFRATIRADLHPCAQQYVHEMLGDMRLCADAGDGEGVAFCAKRIRERVAQERRFERENKRAARAVRARVNRADGARCLRPDLLITPARRRDRGPSSARKEVAAAQALFARVVSKMALPLNSAS